MLPGAILIPQTPRIQEPRPLQLRLLRQHLATPPLPRQHSHRLAPRLPLRRSRMAGLRVEEESLPRHIPPGRAALNLLFVPTGALCRSAACILHSYALYAVSGVISDGGGNVRAGGTEYR